MSARSRRATSAPRLRARSRLLLLGGVLALVAAACAPTPEPVLPPKPPLATGYNPDDAPQAGVAAYTGDGPYKVGVTTLELSDRKVEVWYPADNAQVGSTPKDVYDVRTFLPDWFNAYLGNFPWVVPTHETNAYRGVPAASGAFPLTLFSHGAAGYRLTSTELTTHVASWGFIVISPDYLERGIQSALGNGPGAPRADTTVADEAITAVEAASASTGGLLSGHVDGTKVYPWGHSAGGGTSLRLLQRPDVDTAIPMAAGFSAQSLSDGSAVTPPPGKSVTWIGGQSDGVAAIANVRNGYDYTPGEKKIVEFSGAGHNNGFTEICEIGGVGLIGLVWAVGLQAVLPGALLSLGGDGCSAPPYADSPVLWPQVGHFLVAELRYRSGLDPQPVGLGTHVTASLPNVAAYNHAP
jgi:dienelactone hydrolase